MNDFVTLYFLYFNLNILELSMALPRPVQVMLRELSDKGGVLQFLVALKFADGVEFIGIMI